MYSVGYGTVHKKDHKIINYSLGDFLSHTFSVQNGYCTCTMNACPVYILVCIEANHAIVINEVYIGI